MSDIIDRLRNARTSLGHSLVFGLVAEAADLIEAQQRRIAELEETLDELREEKNCPRIYVHRGGVTRGIYGTSSITAYTALEAELKAVEGELAALRAKIENAEVVAWETNSGGLPCTPKALIRKEGLL